MGAIAVTGATGYLAEKLIERVITQGHTTVSYTHLDVYKRQLHSLVR